MNNKIKNIWVNGTFDVLHIGHIHLLEYASTFGILRVGIDSDRRVTKMKGCDRPINNENNRKKFLESLKYVDSVIIFDDDDELIKNIKEWKTDILVIGSDYLNKKIIGGEFCDEIKFFNRIPNFSTTNIISKCIKLQ
jgi:rfaE bifunctional protein nucleotidyltransferase chain/domain